MKSLCIPEIGHATIMEMYAKHAKTSRETSNLDVLLGVKSQVAKQMKWD